ncbi:MAG: amino acid permease-associated region [Herbinix sp.]|jgi:APA family basic amino acid/polyamine antiporter|nr:amino acid permease-associated region [Herbinix sp.]
MNKRRYGLFTAITMITGVVIGSGIFFKADNVLSYTNGNVLLGVIIFFVAAIAIVFGCLAISQLANLTDKPGGLVAYTEEFVGIGPSCAFGWFQTFLYLPTLAAVVAWVTGIYICQLFGIEFSLESTTLIGLICLTVLFIVNTLSAKLGGYFQNASMLIKLIPLLVIAIAGLIFGKPSTLRLTDMESFRSATTTLGWVAAFAPIAFSFDGWIVATSIGSEIKNSKRNLPLALTISPLIILLAYVTYYIGISSLLGPDTIMEQGDGFVFTAANLIFGNVGAKIILVFVVVSVLGTVNGITLGFIRMPYSLALRNMIPGSNWVKKEEEKLNGMPFNSAILAYVLSVIWMVIHYITQKFGMRGDVSEIAIGVSYLNYIVLYFAVMNLAKKGTIKGKMKGYVIPILATIGSLVIISGSISHPLFIYYFAVCASIMLAGGIYYKKNKNRIL